MKEKILNSKTEITVSGTTYYVSNKGNDSNDGMLPEKAWTTLSKVSSISFQSGDAVLFERGGIWRGNLVAKTGVTYSAYGDGTKPEIIGSLQNYSIKEKWKETGTPNVYVYDQELSNDAGVLVFNDGEACSYKKVIGIDNFTGALDELKNDLEMYHNVNDKKVYLYSDKGNPADRFSSIEFCLRVNIIKIGGYNITIDNLCIKYGGAHGIGAGTCKELKVTNCEFGWIGGSILSGTTRYGNAVEIYGGCDGYTVDNCYIHQIYDTGITHQFSSGKSNNIIMNNVKYTDNLIEYCTWSIEYYLGTPAVGTSPERMMSNIVIKDNICRFAGYGWGNQRPDKTTAAHIKSWDTVNPAENFTIENNIFDRSRYMMVHIGASDATSLPVMKNNTYIQLLDGEFGRYGIIPTTLILFDKEIEKFIKDSLKEQNPEVVYILPYTGEIQKPVNRYINNFDAETHDFIGPDFNIFTASGFDSPALNSAHPYLSSGTYNLNYNFTSILSYPIILKTGGRMSFDEIVLVEPGDAGTKFGDEYFRDFVITEGSLDGGINWKPLADGYDSNTQSSWRDLFNSSKSGYSSNAVPTNDLFVKHEIDMLANGNFNAGDTILFRFRLFSDPYSNGWGWIIDNLAIQDFGSAVNPMLLSSGEVLLFPNPATDRLNLQFQAKKNIQQFMLKAWNSSGALAYNQSFPIRSKVFQTVIDVSKFTAGMYLFALEPENGQVIARKILIQ